jgi:hypothetical protein
VLPFVAPLVFAPLVVLKALSTWLLKPAEPLTAEPFVWPAEPLTAEPSVVPATWAAGSLSWLVIELVLPTFCGPRTPPSVTEWFLRVTSAALGILDEAEELPNY